MRHNATVFDPSGQLTPTIPTSRDVGYKYLTVPDGFPEWQIATSVYGVVRNGEITKGCFNVLPAVSSLSTHTLFFDVESNQRGGHHRDAGEGERTRPSKDTDEKRQHA